MSRLMEAMTQLKRLLLVTSTKMPFGSNIIFDRLNITSTVNSITAVCVLSMYAGSGTRARLSVPCYIRLKPSDVANLAPGYPARLSKTEASRRTQPQLFPHLSLMGRSPIRFPFLGGVLTWTTMDGWATNKERKTHAFLYKGIYFHRIARGRSFPMRIFSADNLVYYLTYQTVMQPSQVVILYVSG